MAALASRREKKARSSVNSASHFTDMPLRKLIPSFTLTGLGGGVVQYMKKVSRTRTYDTRSQKKNRLLHIIIIILFYYFFSRLSRKNYTSKLIFSSVFSHPHFPIRIFLSAFSHPHFAIRILSSAF